MIPEVAVAKLALDEHERYTFVGQFFRVRVAELVRGEAPADASGFRGRRAQLGS